MVKEKRGTLILSWIFGIAELILGFIIQTLKKDSVKYFAFGAILLSALFAFIFYCDENSYKLLQLGLVFTVLADLLLVLLDAKNKTLAMCFFSVTQLSYAALLYLKDQRFKKIHIVLRCVLTSAALIGVFLVLGKKTDALSLISLFYFSNLAVNVIWAFLEWEESKLLAIGLLLFAFCDICIGLSAMSSLYIPISENSILYFLIHPGFNLAWVFYLPSQTLIALSLAEKQLKKE